MHTSRPWSTAYWDERETWPLDRLREYQLTALRRQLLYVYGASRFYGERWDRLGWHPSHLRSFEDLRQLPLTKKQDYAQALSEDSPWGSHVACRPQQLARVHFSSGTTSQPTPDGWTSADLERWSDLYARFAYAHGVRQEDVFQCLFNLAWFVGGMGAVAGYGKIGAAVIPAGSSDSKRQIETMFRFGTTAICGTPSYIVHLIEIAEEMGLDLRDSKVSKIMAGGEPGGNIPSTRQRIEQRWGARCFDGYGSMEFQPVAWECEAQCGGHLAEDFLFAEVLDDQERPVPPGKVGVLTLTHLDKQAYPLVRWWTGDTVMLDENPCSCGRTHARLAGGVRGRADDMLIIRGVNLFPSAIEDVVRRLPGTTGEYLIVLDKDVRDPVSGYLTGIKLKVEIDGGATNDLAEQLRAQIRQTLLVSAQVELLPRGTLPRTTHKAHRIVHES